MMNFKPVPSIVVCDSSNTVGRRSSVRRSFLIRRFLVTVLTIGTLQISSWNTKCRVSAHGMGRFRPALWLNKRQNDQRITTARTRRRTCNNPPHFSFAQESCFRIQRGGANRFVNEDGDDSNENSSQNRMSLGSKGDTKGLRKHSPVVYQYFGRSRSRGGQSFQSQSDESPLNFILLGPNVDHWKTIGQTLAARGFNVMACERMVEKQRGEHEGKPTNYEDAPDLVLEILEALKWEKAVLVGCDDESALAMETALMLAPDRVAGLILCGDLKSANQFAEEQGGDRVVDSFLHRYLDCPFVIVWDGGARSIVSGSSAHEAIETTSSPFDGDGVDGRCVILGGGSAPHRTKPDYFAWVLRRFVEEKLENHSMDRGKQASGTPGSSTGMEGKPRKPRQGRARILQNLNLPFGIDSLVSPEGRLLLGRAVAAAIFYTSAMKVIFVQYGILRMGLISVKNSVDSVDALRRKIFQVTGAFIWNFGYIPRLFRFSSKKTKELDVDVIDIGNNDAEITEPENQTENDENDADPSSTNSDADDESNDDENSPKEDEEDDTKDSIRFKPLFFLDNVFT